ncbi:MAG: helix-turn-helix domain-containing protein [Bacteroidales bacterium]
MNSLGMLLRKYREERGETLRKVAAFLNIDQAILSKIERGHRKATRPQVEKMADYYDADLKEFLVAWLSDKIVYEIRGEVYAEEALISAESQVGYLKASLLRISDIRKAVAREMGKYPAISKAWLFGSYARYESNPESDIDILIDVPGRKGFSMFDLFQIQRDLENALGKKADVVIRGSIKTLTGKPADNNIILIYTADGK